LLITRINIFDETHYDSTHLEALALFACLCLPREYGFLVLSLLLQLRSRGLCFSILVPVALVAVSK